MLHFFHTFPSKQIAFLKNLARVLGMSVTLVAAFISIQHRRHESQYDRKNSTTRRKNRWGFFSFFRLHMENLWKFLRRWKIPLDTNTVANHAFPVNAFSLPSLTRFPPSQRSRCAPHLDSMPKSFNFSQPKKRRIFREHRDASKKSR